MRPGGTGGATSPTDRPNQAGAGEQPAGGTLNRLWNGFAGALGLDSGAASGQPRLNPEEQAQLRQAVDVAGRFAGQDGVLDLGDRARIIASMEGSLQQGVPRDSGFGDTMQQNRSQALGQLNDTLRSLGMDPASVDSGTFQGQWEQAWQDRSGQALSRGDLERLSGSVGMLQSRGGLPASSQGLPVQALKDAYLQQAFGSQRPITLSRPERHQINQGLDSLRQMAGPDGRLTVDDRARVVAGMEDALRREVPAGEGWSERMQEARSQALTRLDGLLERMGMKPGDGIDSKAWNQAWQNRAGNPQLSPQDLDQVGRTLDTLRRGGMNPDLSQGLSVQSLQDLAQWAPHRDLSLLEQAAVGRNPLPLNQEERQQVGGALATLRRLAGEDGVWRPDDRGNNLTQMDGDLSRLAHQEIDRRISAGIQERADSALFPRLVQRVGNRRRPQYHAQYHDEGMRQARSQALGELNRGMQEMGMRLPEGPVTLGGRQLQQLSTNELQAFGRTMQMIGNRVDELGLPRSGFENGLPVSFLEDIHNGVPLMLARRR